MQWVRKRLLLIVSAVVLVAVVSTSFNIVTSDSVYAETADDQGNSTCAVEKIGWLVCPILEKTAQISDAMFDRLANNFLRVDPQLVSNNAESGTRKAWEIARNLANIMFIIAFIIIVLSQVTGQGISNYGIKRMLPRLVVAAIAVNVSYFICQIAVDTSNIFGYETRNALVQISDNIGPSVFGQVSQYSSFSTGADRSPTEAVAQTGILTAIAIGVVASAVVWVMLGPLIAVVFTVFVATLGIIVILMLRKALIVLLIVVSPIAFVMYLLPNTEKLFNRWAKMFVQLLLVFPIVSLLLGAGQLASTIILVSSPTVSQNQNCDPDKNTVATAFSAEEAKENGYTTFCEGGLIIQSKGRSVTGASWTTGLIATGVAVAPLFAVWSVLKGALSAAGSIGGKINDLSSRASRGARNLGKQSDERRRKAVEAAALSGRLGGKYGRRAAGVFQRRRLKNDELDNRLKVAQADFGLTDEKAQNIVQKNIDHQQALSAVQSAQAATWSANNAGKQLSTASLSLSTDAQGKAGDALAAQAAKALAEAIKDAELTAQIDAGDVSSLGDRLDEAVRQGDTITARAVQNLLLKSGSAGQREFHTRIDSAQSSGRLTAGDAVETALRNNISASHPSMNSEDRSIAQWAREGGRLSEHTDGSLAAQTWGGLSAPEFIALKGHAQKAAAPHLSPETVADLRNPGNTQMWVQVSPDARPLVPAAPPTQPTP